MKYEITGMISIFLMVGETPTIRKIDTALAEMNTAWTAASEEIYKAQAEQGGAQPGAEQPNAGGQQQAAGDHVEDAQFEEVK